MFALDECRVGLSGCVLSGFEVPDLFCWDTIDIMKQWSHIVNALRPPIPSDGSVIRRVSLDRWVDPSPLSWAMRGLLSSAMTKYDNLIQFIYQVILLFYIVWWRQISHSNMFYLQYRKLPSALCVCAVFPISFPIYVICPYQLGKARNYLYSLPPHPPFHSVSIFLSQSSISPSLPHTTFPLSTLCVYCVHTIHIEDRIGTGYPQSGTQTLWASSPSTSTVCCSISLQAANLSPPIRTNTLDSTKFNSVQWTSTRILNMSDCSVTGHYSQST